MSYDASIICEHGAELDDLNGFGNMTSNIGVMYDAVMPGPYPGGGRYDGIGNQYEERGGLPGLSGLRCSEALPILEAGIMGMLQREEELRAMEPANGWGSWQGARDFLIRVRDACAEHREHGILAVNW